MVTVTLLGQVTVPASRSMFETVFGEQTTRSDRRVGPTPRVDAVDSERIEELYGAVGGVVIHLRAVIPINVIVIVTGVVVIVGAVLCLIAVSVTDEVANETLSNSGVPGVGGTHRRVGDDLSVRIYCSVALAAVETVRRGLTAVTSVGSAHREQTPTFRLRRIEKECRLALRAIPSAAGFWAVLGSHPALNGIEE